MSTLVEYFSKIILLGLHIDEQLQNSQALKQPYIEFQQELLEGIRSAKYLAEQEGKRSADIEDASFAIVAWLDELVARYPQWSLSATPIQKSLFSTYNAGNEFFTHLNRLTSQQDEVREVYYLCLCLGFVGQYYYETGDIGELARIKNIHERQLPVSPAPLESLAEAHITPQPYLAQDPVGPHIPSNIDQILLRSAVFLAIILPVTALSYLLYTHQPSTSPKHTIKPQIEAVLGSFTCANLTYTQDPNNIITVSGRVATEDDLARLKQYINAIDGVKQATIANVKILIWPFCEVTDFLARYYEQNKQQDFNLRIVPSSRSPRFSEGEYLILNVTAPKYSAYVYVDYYQRDGRVVHLLPNPVDKQNKLTPGQNITLGDPSVIQRRNWQILPPFGQEMITIISSPSPLFNNTRPEIELAKDYLPALRQLLSSTTDEKKSSADYIFIESSQKTP